MNLVIENSYSDWLDEVRAKFEVADEFRLAEAIYSFAADYDNGLSPEAAYRAFDAWATAE